MIINKMVKSCGGWIGITPNDDHRVEIIGDSELKAPLHWTFLRISNCNDDIGLEGGLRLLGSIDGDPYDVDENGQLVIIGVDII